MGFLSLDAVAVAAAAENGGERNINDNFDDEDADAGCEHDLCCYDYSKDVDDEEDDDEEFEEIIIIENKKNLSENDLTKIKKTTKTNMQRSVSFAGPEAMVTIKTVPNFRCDWSLYRHRRSIWYTDGELQRFRREFRQDLRQELRQNTKPQKQNRVIKIDHDTGAVVRDVLEQHSQQHQPNEEEKKEEESSSNGTSSSLLMSRLSI